MELRLPADQRTGGGVRLQYIDGWRAIAVTLVMVGHLLQTSARNLDQFAGLQVLDNALLGVFIFFFISGLVVSRTCLNEVADTGHFSARAFYVRRVFRIIPPLTIYLVTCLLLVTLGLIAPDSSGFFRAFVYLCNVDFDNQSCGWYSGHTWSLAFEEQFYLIFPLVFACVALSRPVSVLKFAVVIPIVALPLFYPLFWVGRTGFVITHGLFALGYLCASRLEQIVDRVRKNAVLVFLCCLFVLLLVPLLGKQLGPDLKFLISKYYKATFLAAIPLLVLSSSAIPSVRMFLEARVVAYFGRISYSIYLWQQLFTGDIFVSGNALVTLLGLLVMWAVCAASFEYLEKHLIAHGARVSRRIRLSDRLAAPAVGDG